MLLAQEAMFGVFRRQVEATASLLVSDCCQLQPSELRNESFAQCYNRTFSILFLSENSQSNRTRLSKVQITISTQAFLALSQSFSNHEIHSLRHCFLAGLCGLFTDHPKRTCYDTILCFDMSYDRYSTSWLWSYRLRMPMWKRYGCHYQISYSLHCSSL
jgi:hypothetical protein